MNCVTALRFTVSATAIGAMLAAAPAAAQNASEEEDISLPSSSSGDNIIIVTGTSLRGVAPVGSNLVSVGREAIEDTGAQTIQQILKTVPQITAAGNAGQGPAGTEVVPEIWTGC